MVKQDGPASATGWHVEVGTDAALRGVRIYDSTFMRVERPDLVKEADVKLVGCTIKAQD